jgi:hypothetical protein
MAESDRHYANALEIVNRYYQRVVEQMAHEICEREESIIEGGYGWTEIEDRYANRFFNISQIYSNLNKFASSDVDEDVTSIAPIGIEASRLQIDERRCPIDATRETIERWLSENNEAYLWKLVVHPMGADQANCLFLFTS